MFILRENKIDKIQATLPVWLQLLLIISVLIMVNSAVAAPTARSIPKWQSLDRQSTFVVDHSAWQRILSKYVDDNHPSDINLFSYSAMSTDDHVYLKNYLAYLQALQPTSLNRDEQLAYWINLYNAQTVNLVVGGLSKNEDMTSIKQIRSGFFKPGPWSKKNMVIEQQKISLDNIEHGILRPNWRDRRLHYVLNCASLGCPDLQKTAFTSSNIDQLLIHAEKTFINHPRAVRREGQTLVLSKLFKWYSRDFAINTKNLITYLSSINSDADIRNDFDGLDINIDYEYGWKLNSPQNFEN